VRTVKDLAAMMNELIGAGYAGSVVLLSEDEEGNAYAHLDDGVSEEMTDDGRHAVVLWPSVRAELREYDDEEEDDA
jgi:hypothetical protein